MATDIAAIKARRDWREGRDLSQFEVRLDDECLAKHYAEDVTFLLGEVERLRAVDEAANSLIGLLRHFARPLEASGPDYPPYRRYREARKAWQGVWDMDDVSEGTNRD